MCLGDYKYVLAGDGIKGQIATLETKDINIDGPGCLVACFRAIGKNAPTMIEIQQAQRGATSGNTVHSFDGRFSHKNIQLDVVINKRNFWVQCSVIDFWQTVV